MDILKKKEYLLEKIRKDGCNCSWFQHFALDSWLRIQFARTRSGLRVHETSITQNLVFEFMLYSIINPSNISVFEEASDEPTNGNDMEMILRFKDGSELFLCLQAKLLYKNGKYDQMKSHPEQIISLMNYAYEKRGLPLYLLYNFEWLDDSFEADQYGCSIIDAFRLKKNYYNRKENSKGNLVWLIPTFFNLHPEYALPWNVLGCEAKMFDNAESFARFLFEGSEFLNDALEYISPIKDRSHINYENWKQLTLELLEEKKQLKFYQGEKRNNPKNTKIKKAFFDQVPDKFKPRFRIVMSLNK